MFNAQINDQNHDSYHYTLTQDNQLINVDSKLAILKTESTL